MSITVLVQQLSHGKRFALPAYATEYSSGVDLRAAIDHDVILASGQRSLIPTGIAIALPVGFEAQVRSRSGLAAKQGVVVLNSPGTIDADYRGEIKVILQNHGGDDFIITPGMRVAQMVIAPVVTLHWQYEEKLPVTPRHDQGFGSTGL